MILGTSRRWWIAAALLVVGGIALVGTGSGGTLGTVAGVLLLLAGIAVFAAAPMRHGQGARQPKTGNTAPAAPPVPAAPTEQPRPRARVESGDPSEV